MSHTRDIPSPRYAALTLLRQAPSPDWDRVWQYNCSNSKDLQGHMKQTTLGRAARHGRTARPHVTPPPPLGKGARKNRGSRGSRGNRLKGRYKARQPFQRAPGNALSKIEPLDEGLVLQEGIRAAKSLPNQPRGPKKPTPPTQPTQPSRPRQPSGPNRSNRPKAEKRSFRGPFHSMAARYLHADNRLVGETLMPPVPSAKGPRRWALQIVWDTQERGLRDMIMTGKSPEQAAAKLDCSFFCLDHPPVTLWGCKRAMRGLSCRLAAKKLADMRSGR